MKNKINKNKLKTIAVIGTGIMGSGMALNFLKHGYHVVVWNRHSDKLKPLLKAGAIAAPTPQVAAAQSDIIFEVTASDASSRAVWYGENGILHGATKKSYLVASGTLSVRWIDELSKKCNQKGLTFFDMPLTGSRGGAEGGTLTLLVGGNKNKLHKIETDLAAISEHVWYFGKAGSGMRFKLLLNMLAAIHIAAFGEALKIARAIGLNLQLVGDTLVQKPGGAATTMAWRHYKKIPKPINFSAQWILKDLQYAKQLQTHLDTPFLKDVIKKYQKIVAAGNGGEDWTIVTRD
ncbi:MAG: NAD(P)-dependent oxidoreductase [Candidatus Magasanikbacteria bacterium]|nr:NAD(P)-dependent oxidoreductase [Candidatus Magasanikbacteria bacterium]